MSGPMPVLALPDIESYPAHFVNDLSALESRRFVRPMAVYEEISSPNARAISSRVSASSLLLGRTANMVSGFMVSYWVLLLAFKFKYSAKNEIEL